MGALTALAARLLRGPFSTDFSQVTRFVEHAKKTGHPAVEIQTTASAARSAAENFDIAEEQARLGRDPWHISDVDRQRFNEAAQRVAETVIAERPISPALDRLGTFMLAAFQRNFDASRSTQGGMTDIRQGYRESKIKNGYDPRPLIRTRQLRNSIRFKIRRK